MAKVSTSKLVSLDLSEVLASEDGCKLIDLLFAMKIYFMDDGNEESQFLELTPIPGGSSDFEDWWRIDMSKVTTFHESASLKLTPANQLALDESDLKTYLCALYLYEFVSNILAELSDIDLSRDSLSFLYIEYDPDHKT